MALLYDDYGSQDSKALGLDEMAVEIFLDPGEYFVGDSMFQARTLLGSCVSMILWHPRMQYGAMSHFMLSTRVGARTRERFDEEAPEPQGKYADEVLELMMDELRQADVPLAQCQAKVFGGGNMFLNRSPHELMNIGKKNGETALRLLKANGFTIAAQHLYGDGHREVIFNLSSGDVWVRQVPLDVRTAKKFT